MRCNLTVLKALVASIVSCTALSSHADITKCVDPEGRISYSNEGPSACNDRDTVSYIVTTTPEKPNVEVAPRVVSRSALDNTVIRESAWAQSPVTMHRTMTDASTVREARSNLQAIDRALVSMRTQKVASSR